MAKKFNVISTYEDKAPDVLKFEIGTVKRDIFSQIMAIQIKADFEEDIAKTLWKQKSKIWKEIRSNDLIVCF
jgi:hypothetical protein